jgi:NADH:ubiquinone oxidoreductase subunit 5 (subunit L)/multisubunit Na+/H+ antiporter MnhA subunit
MTAPLVVLAVFCVWFWYNPDPTSLLNPGWVAAFIPKPATAVVALVAGEEALVHAQHTAHAPALLLSLACAGAGILVAWRMHRAGSLSLEQWRLANPPLYRVLANKYYVDEFYNRTFIAATLTLSRVSGWFDKVVIDAVVNAVGRFETGLSELAGLVDKFGVDGLVNFIGNFVRDTGNEVRQIQTGRIQNYLVYAAIGLIGLIVIVGM